MGARNSTIAFVTDDGSTISAHFGRALYYEIITLQNGEVTDRKHLSKAGHHTFGQEGDDKGGHGDPHHQDHKHAAMTALLAGASVLIARGMGTGAQHHLLASGIRPILTDLRTIDEALKQYVAGTLVDNPNRLHAHGPRHRP
jgi:predicted Fe-Mo cluster-binding NifX family protein